MAFVLLEIEIEIKAIKQSRNSNNCIARKSSGHKTENNKIYYIKKNIFYIV